MNINTAVRVIASAAGTSPVLFTAGGTGRVARRLVDRPNHLYLESVTGLASSVGIGVALQARHTTLVVDDPDSLLTNLAALVTAGMLTDLPLVHIVLDDLPAQATSGRADLCALAMALGYPRTYTIDRIERLGELVRREVVHCPSPAFVRCVLSDTTSPGRARVIRLRRRRPPGDGPTWLREAA
jgi:sulfopyruvate decarboxylase subunit beta